jgi:multidrug efflux pump subunit AcrA (membrane-fusion protein)
MEEMGVESIFIVEDGKAVRRIVQTGYGENGMIEITEGLEETDNVITVGQLGLKPDATVIVINAPPAPEAVAEDAN